MQKMQKTRRMNKLDFGKQTHRRCSVCGDTCQTNVKFLWKRHSDCQVFNVCAACYESNLANADSVQNYEKYKGSKFCRLFTTEEFAKYLGITPEETYEPGIAFVQIMPNDDFYVIYKDGTRRADV